MSLVRSFPGLSSRGASRALLCGALVFAAACDDNNVSIEPAAASVDVTPRLVSVRAGQSTQLTAQAKDANGNDITNGTVVWSSLDTTVARVSSSGVVTVVSSGVTAIVASTRDASGFASVDGVGNVAQVLITGSNGSLPVQQTVQLSAATLEANGRDLLRPVVWSSSAPTIATVSSTGLVTTIAAGTTNITATVDGQSATLAFTVLPPAPVATVALSPNSGFLPTTVGVPFSATLRDANNGVLSGRVVTWSSSNDAIATVSGTGVVTGQAEGTVTITATSEGKSGSATFTTLAGLKSGVGVTVNGPTTDESRYFAFYVPAGSTNLSVTLRNGNGDPDLYIYRPGANTSTCASETGGATVSETCTIANPAAGVWVVEVYTYSPHTGTTLTATVTP